VWTAKQPSCDAERDETDGNEKRAQHDVIC